MPRFVDDPDCVRHFPAPRPTVEAEYDVTTLGLAPHDRGSCARCQAVGA